MGYTTYLFFPQKGISTLGSFTIQFCRLVIGLGSHDSVTYKAATSVICVGKKTLWTSWTDLPQRLECQGQAKLANNFNTCYCIETAQ